MALEYLKIKKLREAFISALKNQGPYKLPRFKRIIDTNSEVLLVNTPFKSVLSNEDQVRTFLPIQYAIESYPHGESSNSGKLLQTLEELKSIDADINGKNTADNDNTPLHYAVWYHIKYGDNKIFFWFLNNDAFNLPNFQGITPAQLLRESSYKVIANVIELKSEINFAQFYEAA